ncbi:hypothetical protein FQN57_007117 [Myotisia sp. PD_48]|nr:hypothetical protein FQN57_007117 [Myotisia sp. PD_48]
MKISIILSMLAAVSMANPVTQQEADELYRCADQILNDFHNGRGGDGAACQYGFCLERYAKNNNRGGILVKLTPVLNTACNFESLLGGFIPFGGN